MRFCYKKRVINLTTWAKFLNFTGICIGNFGFGVIHRHKATDAELQEIVDSYHEKGKTNGD